MKKLLKLGCLSVIGAVLLLGVVAALGGKGASTTTTPTGQQQLANSSKPQQSANTAEPTTAPTPPPSIGQDVRVGDVRWKVLSAENLGKVLKSNNRFIKDLKTSGTFVKVRFEVENLSNDLLSYGGADLVDIKGRKFTQSSDALSFISEEEQSVLVTNINPNISKTITEIYEVPPDAAGLKFNAGDLKIFGSDETQIELGLQ
jgi:hypothetical protein